MQYLKPILETFQKMDKSKLNTSQLTQLNTRLNFAIHSVLRGTKQAAANAINQLIDSLNPGYMLGMHPVKYHFVS